MRKQTAYAIFIYILLQALEPQEHAFSKQQQTRPPSAEVRYGNIIKFNYITTDLMHKEPR